MKKIIIYILWSLPLFSGCDGIPGVPSEPVFEVEGYIYNNCSLEPYANQTIQLWQNYEIGLLNDYGGVLDETTTDESGHFKFNYSRENYSYYPTIQTPGGYDIMIIPWDTNIYDVVAYFTPTCNIKVSLNVINSYTEDDTLIIGDYRTLENMAVPGPLSSGTLYTVENFPLLSIFYYGVVKRMNWYITPYNDNTIYQDFIIDKYCEDTVYVTVDIY